MVSESETLAGSLADIRAFCAVVDFGSVSAAARHLAETKGSVSRRMSRLERRLGATLLARTPRAVSATEEGLAFHAKAADALHLLDDALEGARQSRSLPRGLLRVTAATDIGLEVLAPLIVRFRARYPQIRVDLLLEDATLDLAANRIDVALRAVRGDLPDMGYRASALIDFRIALYAGTAYLDGRGQPRRPADLADHDLVASREPTAAAHWQLRHRRGRREQVAAAPALRTGSYASAHRLLLAGGGIGALPDLVAARSLAEGHLRRVLPEWTVDQARLYAISLSGHAAPARVRLFRELLREELAGLLADA